MYGKGYYKALGFVSKENAVDILYIKRYAQAGGYK
jgi:hypothetical protein